MYSPVSPLQHPHHHPSRPSSRSSLQTTSSRLYSIEPPVRPSSTNTFFRTAAERGSFSPYDDETPSPSPTLPSSRPHLVDDDLYSPPPTGHRLPPLPVRSPINVENSFRSRPSSVVSTASTTRKSHTPSIHMTGPSPTSNHGFAPRYPASARVARPTRRGDSSSDDDSSSRRSSMLRPRSAVAASFDIDFSFLDEEPPPRPSAFGGTRAFGGSGRKERPSSTVSERAPPKPRVQDTQDYFTLKAMAEQLPSTSSLVPFVLFSVDLTCFLPSEQVENGTRQVRPPVSPSPPNSPSPLVHPVLHDKSLPNRG
jgi:hypothetical protein